MAKILVTLYTYPQPKSYSSKILSDKRLLADLVNYPLAGRSTIQVEEFGNLNGTKHYVWTPSGCKASLVDENIVSTFGLDPATSINDKYWIVDDDAIPATYPAVKAAAPKVDAPLCACDKCGEVNPWGEPNTDKGTYRCHSCRQDPYRCCFASSD
jgi:hypothetical protein